MAATAALYQNNLQNNIQDHNAIAEQNQYMSTFFCRALYDYQSRDASSLSFHKGDIIEVLTQLDSGWWDGLLHDERGWFPSNYVAPISVQEIEEELRVARSESHEEDWVQEEQAEPAGPPSHFWMPEVTSDGRIFYVNTQTGERSNELPTDAEHDHEPEPFVQNSFMSPTASSANGSRPTDPQMLTPGFGLPKRSGTPEPWVRRLADDGMSYYYLNTIDKSIRWTAPSPRFDRPATNALDPYPLADGFQPANSAADDDKLSLYSDDSDNNPLGILGRVAHTHSDSITNAATPTPGQHQDDIPGIAEARELQAFLQERFAPPPESFHRLAQTAKAAVADVLDIALSRDSSLDIKEAIKETMVSIRNLVYASATLPGPLSSLPPPYPTSKVPPDFSELKQFHRKVSATMVKFLSAVRASESDTSTTEDTHAGFERDAKELENAITTFEDEVLRRLSPPRETRRVRAVLISGGGHKGVGLSLFGAGAAGGWKGFGFVEPLDGEALGANTLVLLNQCRNKLHGALAELETFNAREKAPTAIFQAQEVVRYIVLFLGLVMNINIARSIDVDSTSTAIGDPAYIQSVGRARALIRALEAGVQAIFDDGAVVLDTIQSVAQGVAILDTQDVNRSWADLLLAVPALRSNIDDVCTVLEGLVETVLYQDDACAKAGLDRAIGLRYMMLGSQNDGGHYLAPRSHSAPRTDVVMDDDPLVASDGEDLVDLGAAFGARPSTTRDHDRFGISRNGRSDTSIDKLYDSVRADAPNGTRSQPGSASSRDKETSTITLVEQEASPLPNDEEYEVEDFPVSVATKNPPKAEKIKKILGADAPDAYIKMANADSKPWYLRAEHGPKEIFINPDGSVRGGTLPALIERLTMHDNRDANFINTFLVTYKSFTTLDEVFDSLVKRFNMQPPAKLTSDELKEWTEQKQVVVRLRVINIFKSIVMDEDVLEKEDVHILDRIKAFASTVEKEVAPPIPAAKQLLVLVDRAQSGGDAMIKMTQHTPNFPPPSIMPKTSKAMKLLDIDPLELARQLTLMESKMFAKIRPMECLNRGRDGKPGDSDDNISAIIDTSNKVAEWVADAVLSKDDSRKRATIVKQFIAVADRCRHLQNFSTMAALVAGLNSPPIRRLKRTWEQVNARSKTQLQEAERTMDTNKNFTNYRAILKGAQLPCVPFFGVYLSVLTFIQDGNRNMLQEDIINFGKRERFAEVIREIKHYQSKPYNLNLIPSVQAYIDDSLSALGNTTDLSDRAWNLSLEREPREREDEKMARLLQESGFL